MKQLRILTISHMFPSADSRRHGIFICREALALRKEGIECCFLVGRPSAPWPLYLLRRWRRYGPANPLVPPEGLLARRATYFRPPGFGFRRFEGKSMAHGLLPAAQAWHREDPFDLVLGVSMFPDAEAAVAIGQALGLPVVSLAVGSDVMVYPARMPALCPRLCDLLARVDLPVGASESICERLADTGKCQQEPLCVYLSRDTKDFAPAQDKTQVRRQLGWAPGHVVAIYVGGLVETKGMRVLVTASEPLLRRHDNFRLICVGGGPSRGALLALRDRLGRDEAVVLPGRVAPEEVPLWLQGSDFLVLPSYSEGMPQAVLEAMNCGLAVVATRIGGVPEAVIDGETGLLVEARNPRQLGEAMEQMITDEAFRVAAGEKGQARAREVFDPERNAKKFADALWTLGGGRPVSPHRWSESADA
jgi:glycosyltransferase involved in cell wall biosynthesis